MHYEVSIIIPTYNRYPLNLLSLQALEKQEFDLSKMEVILIDDMSTDDTHLLEKYQPPYRFKYIRHEHNSGLAKTRNTGIKNAKGKILIFMDAEIIVDPQFVQCHYKKHLENQNAIVTGGNILSFYSTLFPTFNDFQISELSYLLNKRKMFKETLRERVQKDIRDASSLIKSLSEPIQFVSSEDIRNINLLNDFSIPKESGWFNKVITDVTSFDDCQIPWLLCLGLNHSVKKEFVERVEPYDENFKAYGLEDYEFGYRLFKAGGRFIADPNITIYHQEHPAKRERATDECENLVQFIEKHPEIGVAIYSISYINKQDFPFMNNVLKEHKFLCQHFPNMYNHFKTALFRMLHQIPLQKSTNKTPKKLLRKSGIKRGSKWKAEIFSERDIIEANGMYPHLIQLFDMLAKK
ncbi:hypothetical protein AF332_03500 [Sporosarcina globispora]|uniref:Glycosyltransferase 2-like domain-containing protein n=1 Tax=Sporosarcina globispora TaxID=1459 RepID=A0A0M0G7V6_SPOGL|nr:glycosyltransferase family 2 protein [Sporosarcina globispora]KON85965.1 hypothetical protein AF332_03500 [Sporosarcina globispora]